MVGQFVSINSKLVPAEQGTVSIDDVNFAYGYGVYETLKSRGSVVFFPELHVDRLLNSAKIIGLSHGCTKEMILETLELLVRANRIADCNIKILMVGKNDDDANLYMMCLSPLFPKRSDYRDGAKAILFEGERQYPQAKSLNMLVSTIAFRKAQGAGAYDAILVNRHGELTEGTRTNLFYSDGANVFTPPAVDVLEGVTKLTITQCFKQIGVPVLERKLRHEDLSDQRRIAGLWLSSTSTKMMPLSLVDNIPLRVDPKMQSYIKAYDDWLAQYKAERPIWV